MILILHHIALITTFLINHLNLVIFIFNNWFIAFFELFLSFLRQNLVHHESFLLIYSLVNYLDFLLIQDYLIRSMVKTASSIIRFFETLEQVFCWRMRRIKDWLWTSMLTSLPWTLPSGRSFLISSFLSHERAHLLRVYEVGIYLRCLSSCSCYPFHIMGLTKVRLHFWRIFLWLVFFQTFIGMRRHHWLVLRKRRQRRMLRILSKPWSSLLVASSASVKYHRGAIFILQDNLVVLDSRIDWRPDTLFIWVFLNSLDILALRMRLHDKLLITWHVRIVLFHLLQNLLSFLLLLFINTLELFVWYFILKMLLICAILAHSDDFSFLWSSSRIWSSSGFLISNGRRHIFRNTPLRWRHRRVMCGVILSMRSSLLTLSRERFHEFPLTFAHILLWTLVSEYFIFFATILLVFWVYIGGKLRLVSLIHALDWDWFLVLGFWLLLLWLHLRVETLACVVH